MFLLIHAHSITGWCGISIYPDKQYTNSACAPGCPLFFSVNFNGQKLRKSITYRHWISSPRLSATWNRLLSSIQHITNHQFMHTVVLQVGAVFLYTTTNNIRTQHDANCRPADTRSWLSGQDLGYVDIRVVSLAVKSNHRAVIAWDGICTITDLHKTKVQHKYRARTPNQHASFLSSLSRSSWEDVLCRARRTLGKRFMCFMIKRWLH